MQSDSPRPRAILAKLALLLVSTLLTLLAIELVLRVASGMPITSREIDDLDIAGAGSERDMTSFAAAVSAETAPIDPSWINLAPPPLPGRETTDPEFLAWREAAREAVREAAWDGYEAELYRQWNSAYLDYMQCDERSPVHDLPVPAYEFDPIDGSPFPIYRYLPQRTDPLGMRTNQFGWRGAELPVDKPLGTVRLAFVGASTTVGSKHCRASYPEYVIHWMNLWAREHFPEVRFDGLNAGREGLSSSNIAAVVRTEVLPMEPDLIMYYEGVNQLARWIEHAEGLADVARPAPREKSGMDEMLDRASRHSMLALRLRVFLAGLRRSGAGVDRPPHEIPWPDSVDEMQPDPFDAELPFAMPTVLRNLDAIQRLATQNGSRLVIASFVFLLDDGVELDPWRHGLILDSYRNGLWPLDHAEIRRVADFQNRVLFAWALARLVAFVDLADAYPQDPSLFLDGVHFNCDGIRLQAWIVLQRLLPFVRSHLESGKWPRPDHEATERHPAFMSPRLVEDRCPEGELPESTANASEAEPIAPPASP